jgi:multicomponent K+:H+ antiporter subunit E
VLFVALLVIWLLLTQSLTPANIVLGALLAGALAWTSAGLRPLRPRLRSLHLGFGLAGVVLGDIARSNFAVACIVLGLKRGTRSGLVAIPLELRDPHGLAVLAAIVTSTPGTVWVDLDNDTHTLTLHLLDLENAAGLIDWIKSRYEQPLRRIFE